MNKYTNIFLLFIFPVMLQGAQEIKGQGLKKSDSIIINPGAKKNTEQESFTFSPNVYLTAAQLWLDKRFSVSPYSDNFIGAAKEKRFDASPSKDESDR